MHVCRFYKLFLDYLEERFQQSEDESIKELVGQFQGEYAYTTVCQACKTVSQRKCQFSELELNLKVNSLHRRWQCKQWLSSHSPLLSPGFHLAGSVYIWL
jgi:hypothetical protein